MPPETSNQPERARPAIPDSPTRRRRRRRALLLSAGAVVALGLVLRTVPGTIGDVGGGILYAVLLFLLTAALLPSVSAMRIGAISFAVCASVELLQLTALPTAAAALFPPIRYVLGTTFVAADLLAYAAGTVFAVVADAAVLRRTRRRPNSHRSDQ